jgi:hypothetical protein
LILALVSALSKPDITTNSTAAENIMIEFFIGYECLSDCTDKYGKNIQGIQSDIENMPICNREVQKQKNPAHKCRVIFHVHFIG